MRRSRWRLLPGRLILVMASLGAAGVLTGCASAGGATDELAGFAAGSAAGALTGNPFIAVGIGMATRFASGEARAYIDRRNQKLIRAAIAEAAGAAGEGEIVPLACRNSTSPPATLTAKPKPCALSTARSNAARFSTALRTRTPRISLRVICRHPDGWRWAIAGRPPNAGDNHTDEAGTSSARRSPTRGARTSASAALAGGYAASRAPVTSAQVVNARARAAGSAAGRRSRWR